MSEYTREDYARLFSKMQQVMGDVGEVEKSGYNQYQKYNYMESDVIVSLVRQSMLVHGLTFAVSMRSVELNEYETTIAPSKVRLDTRALVHLDMMVMDCDTGCTLTFQFSNEAHDTSDKAINKAVTAAKKYWLINTFLISTPDAPDADNQHPERTRQNAQNAPKNAPNGTQAKQPLQFPENAQTGAQGQGGAIQQTPSISNMQVKIGQGNKPYIVIGGVTFFSGQLLRDAGLDYSTADLKKGSHNLPFPVIVQYQVQENGFKQPIKVVKA